jgi:cytochrome c oxidase cbb3-type subunit 3
VDHHCRSGALGRIHDLEPERPAAQHANDSGAGLRYHGVMRFLLVLIMASLLIAAVFAADGYAARQLLRADPDALPAHAMSLHFAVRRGRPLFEARCAVCHGASGSGDTAKGVPNLTDQDWLYGTGRPSEIERVIDYGIRSRNPKAWNLAIMPAYARPQPNPADKNIQPLTPGEIDDVIEFLMRQQARPAGAGAAARGAALFLGHGGCYDCHSVDAKGDSAIGAPNLSDAVTLYGDGSREALHMSIAYGRQGVCPAWINRASAASIRELALYVYSISHPGAGQNDN